MATTTTTTPITGLPESECGHPRVCRLALGFVSAEFDESRNRSRPEPPTSTLTVLTVAALDGNGLVKPGYCRLWGAV